MPDAQLSTAILRVDPDTKNAHKPTPAVRPFLGLSLVKSTVSQIFLVHRQGSFDPFSEGEQNNEDAENLKTKYDPLNERFGSMRTVGSLSHTSALVATCTLSG
jgi:hypothetical protein